MRRFTALVLGLGCVAGATAQRFVDRPKAVHVTRHDRDLGASLPGIVQCLRQALMKERAIGKPRERIIVGKG